MVDGMGSLSQGKRVGDRLLRFKAFDVNHSIGVPLGRKISSVEGDEVELAG
jgi:hypothetical protein